MTASTIIPFDALFSWFCSQGPEHLWSPGGITLPFCQRCTGLYVGACFAAALQLLLRTPNSRPRALLEGLLLLQMVPLGYHWVPQTGTIRTLSSGLFAFGLIGFLARLPSAHWPALVIPAPDRRPRLHAVLAAASLGIIMVAVRFGGARTAHVLAWLGFAGALALAALVLINLGLLARSWWRTACRLNRLAAP